MGYFTYQPDAGFAGTDTFIYYVRICGGCIPGPTRYHHRDSALQANNDAYTVIAGQTLTVTDARTGRAGQ